MNIKALAATTAVVGLLAAGGAQASGAGGGAPITRKGFPMFVRSFRIVALGAVAALSLAAGSLLGGAAQAAQTVRAESAYVFTLDCGPGCNNNTNFLQAGGLSSANASVSGTNGSFGITAGAYSADALQAPILKSWFSTPLVLPALLLLSNSTLQFNFSCKMAACLNMFRSVKVLPRL